MDTLADADGEGITLPPLSRMRYLSAAQLGALFTTIDRYCAAISEALRALPDERLEQRPARNAKTLAVRRDGAVAGRDARRSIEVSSAEEDDTGEEGTEDTCQEREDTGEEGTGDKCQKDKESEDDGEAVQDATLVPSRKRQRCAASTESRSQLSQSCSEGEGGKLGDHPGSPAECPGRGGVQIAPTFHRPGPGVWWNEMRMKWQIIRQIGGKTYTFYVTPLSQTNEGMSNARLEAIVHAESLDVIRKRSQAEPELKVAPLVEAMKKLIYSRQGASWSSIAPVS